MKSPGYIIGYMKMRKLTMFITAVYVLFLVKLRWPWNKSLWIRVDTLSGPVFRNKLNLSTKGTDFPKIEFLRTTSTIRNEKKNNILRFGLP